ncbi:MAG: PAS domain S-box protein [Anaerolineales bacterium]|nr:PAS domain S-box protein [Anaerolineales bacterium]
MGKGPRGQLLAVTPFGILDCVLDERKRDYRILTFSPVTSCDLQDWVAEDQTTLSAFFTGDLGTRLLQWLVEVSRKSGDHGRIQAICPQGGEKIFNISLWALEDQRYLVQMTDAGKDAEAVRKLEDRLTLLQTIIDAEPNPIFIRDGGGRYTLGNKAFSSIYGVAPEFISGKTDLELQQALGVTEGGVGVFFPSESEIGQVGESDFYEQKSITTSEGGTRWFRTVQFPLREAGFTDHVLYVGVDITTEIDVRRDLEAQVRFLDSLLETVPIPIFYQDREGVYLGCNEAFLELSGLTYEQLIGCTIEDVWPGSRAALYLRENEALFQTEEKQAFSRREEMKGGVVSDLAVLKAPFYDSEGEPAGIIGAAIDFTEQKHIQSALLESEKRYRRLFKDSILGNFMVSADGALREINNSFAKMFGYESIQEALTIIANISSVFSPDQAGNTPDLASFVRGGPATFEADYRCRDGTFFTGRTHVWPVQNPVTGEPYLEGSIDNVTEQRASERALITSEERFRRLYESVQVGVLVQQKDGRIVHANQRAVEILNLPVEEIISRPAEHPEWQMVLEDGTPVSWEQHPSILTLKTGQAYRNVIRGLFSQQGERQRWILINTTPVYELDSGEIREVIIAFSDITELKKTKDELQESERRLTTLMGNLPGMAYRCKNDRSWTMTFVSQGCQSLTGYPPEDLLWNRRKSYAELIHPQDRDLVWNSVQEGIQQNRQYKIEYRILTRDGEERWVWEQGCLVEEQDGGLLEGFIIDISDRRLAQDALEEREELLSRVLDTSPVGIGVVKEFKLEFVNDYFCNMMGYTRNEILQQHPGVMFSSEEEYERVIKELSEILPRERKAVIEVSLRRKDGSILIGQNHIRASNPEDPDSELTFAFLDVTERRRAQEALREQELYFRTVFEESPVGIAIVDLDMCFIDVNPAFVNFVGYSNSEIAGKHLRDITHPDDIENNLRLQGQLARGEISQFRMEKRFIRKDGSIAEGLLVAAMIYDSHSMPQHFMGQVLDITKRKEAEEEVRRINQELEERVRIRTAEIETANEDLRRFARLAAGRELRMAELKQEIKTLRGRLSPEESEEGNSER